MYRLRVNSDLSDTSLFFLLFVATVVAGAAFGRQAAFAVYLVSYLHYGLYWRTFAWGTESFEVFKRDAILLKTLSILALAWAYLQAPLDAISLLVIGLGILLSVRAAVVMGIDRTYYGREVGGLAPLHVTAFPYALIAHPMIVGNVLAFGGTLINPVFRAEWWPLATLHVVLNLALLAMELAGPQRRVALRVTGFAVLAVIVAAAWHFGRAAQLAPQAYPVLIGGCVTGAILIGAATLRRRLRSAVPGPGAGIDNVPSNLKREAS